MTAVEGASERRACKTLDVPRSAARCASTPPRPSPINSDLQERIAFLIQTYPTYGYRRLWAILRRRHGLTVNRKAVYRILKLKGWMVHQRVWTPRPRVKGRVSRAERSDQHGGVGTAGGFAVFPDRGTGEKALGNLLMTKRYQAETVHSAIATYAPPGDGNITKSYQAFVSGQVGVVGSTRVGDLTCDQLDTMRQAIQRYEGWQTGSVSIFPY